MIKHPVVILAITLLLLPFVGFAIMEGISKYEEVDAAGKARWIGSNIVPGMKRVDVYGLLRSKGLVAYNDMYEKGVPVPAADPDPKNPLVGTGCDMRDHSSTMWPFKNEPIPKLEGGCADESLPKNRVINPAANVELGGASNFICGWTTLVKINFSNEDRVTKIQIDKPQVTCL